MGRSKDYEDIEGEGFGGEEMTLAPLAARQLLQRTAGFCPGLASNYASLCLSGHLGRPVATGVWILSNEWEIEDRN